MNLLTISILLNIMFLLKSVYLINAKTHYSANLVLADDAYLLEHFIFNSLTCQYGKVYIHTLLGEMSISSDFLIWLNIWLPWWCSGK